MVMKFTVACLLRQACRIVGAEKAWETPVHMAKIWVSSSAGRRIDWGNGADSVADCRRTRVQWENAQVCDCRHTRV